MFKSDKMKNALFTDEQLRQIEQLRSLAKQKNAVIMAHYYTRPEIQEAADFIGDSLALSEKAANTDADIILFAGVHFMAETAKILSPKKKVLLPDPEAGCSLAASCEAKAFAEFLKQYPDYTVVSYVNTSVGVKALTDIVVTSSNACKIIESLPVEQPILFGPDRNLGNYINVQTGRKMKLWNGGCIVHEKFSVHKLKQLKNEHPEAKVLAHPECKKEILDLADKIASTKGLLDYAVNSDCRKFIVVTEPGILYEMRNRCPSKEFLTVSAENGSCNECEYMRLNTLEKLYACLRDETPEIKISKELCEKAAQPIYRMLEISKQCGLIK